MQPGDVVEHDEAKELAVERVDRLRSEFTKKSNPLAAELEYQLHRPAKTRAQIAQELGTNPKSMENHTAKVVAALQHARRGL